MEQAEASLRPGLGFAVQVQALAELGSAHAGAILRKQLHRRLSDDPVEQAWSEPQACPQAPQFAPLVSRSTHAVPQAVPPDGQVQVPLLHDCALPQAWPQAPQLALLVWTSTHTPPQGASPTPQPEAAPH